MDIALTGVNSGTMKSDCLLPCLPTISATCSELGTGTHSVMFCDFLLRLSSGPEGTMNEEGRGPSESATEAAGEVVSPKPVFSMDSSMASWRVRWSSNPLSQNMVPGIVTTPRGSNVTVSLLKNSQTTCVRAYSRSRWERLADWAARRHHEGSCEHVRARGVGGPATLKWRCAIGPAGRLEGVDGVRVLKLLRTRTLKQWTKDAGGSLALRSYTTWCGTAIYYLCLAPPANSWSRVDRHCRRRALTCSKELVDNGYLVSISPYIHWPWVYVCWLHKCCIYNLPLLHLSSKATSWGMILSIPYNI